MIKDDTTCKHTSKMIQVCNSKEIWTISKNLIKTECDNIRYNIRCTKRSWQHFWMLLMYSFLRVFISNNGCINELCHLTMAFQSVPEPTK